MNAASKTTSYGATALGTAAFGFLYFRQNSLIQHGNPASKPLLTVYLALLIVSAVGLALVCFFDGKRYFSGRMEEWMVEGSAPTEPVPELEQAQKVRASGDPLEAIRLLRELPPGEPLRVTCHVPNCRDLPL